MTFQETDFLPPQRGRTYTIRTLRFGDGGTGTETFSITASDGQRVGIRFMNRHDVNNWLNAQITRDQQGGA